MKFGYCLPCLLQKIWEADPYYGPVLLSTWDISDAFHQYIMTEEDVGAFAYVVPPLTMDKMAYLCVELVIPMGWVNYPPFLFVASEVEVDLTNLYIADP